MNSIGFAAGLGVKKARKPIYQARKLDIQIMWCKKVKLHLWFLRQGTLVSRAANTREGDMKQSEHWYECWLSLTLYNMVFQRRRWEMAICKHEWKGIQIEQMLKLDGLTHVLLLDSKEYIKILWKSFTARYDRGVRLDCVCQE